MIQTSKKVAKYNKENSILKIAIVKSNYHSDLTSGLEKACRQTLIASGVKEEKIETFEAPGSWEIPLIVKKVATGKKFDGIIAFGIIIKGETYHFELIASESAQALMNIALKSNIPITFEILATYNLTQAKNRSFGKHNKGIEAAKTLLETIETLSRL